MDKMNTMDLSYCHFVLFILFILSLFNYIVLPRFWQVPGRRPNKRKIRGVRYNRS